jgi:hypothetical protein
LITTNKSDDKETIIQATRKRKGHKSNRFRSFFRYIFCQFVPLHSNVPVAIDANNLSGKNSNDNAVSDTKVVVKLNDTSQVKVKDFKSLKKQKKISRL